MPEATLLWAPRAWTPAGWRENVLLRIGADGRWSEVAPDVAHPPEGSHRIVGPLLPGLVNAHSHAFQRAFAGRAERREAESDDFWSWRDRMYRVALRISPDQLRDVAVFLQARLEARTPAPAHIEPPVHPLKPPRSNDDVDRYSPIFVTDPPRTMEE